MLLLHQLATLGFGWAVCLDGFRGHFSILLTIAGATFVWTLGTLLMQVYRRIYRGVLCSEQKGDWGRLKPTSFSIDTQLLQDDALYEDWENPWNRGWRQNRDDVLGRTWWAWFCW